MFDQLTPIGQKRIVGHAAKGGIQNHSLGEDYPLTIVGTQAHADAPTEWYVMNCVTGKKGFTRRTYVECQLDITQIKIRNMMHK